MTDSLNSDHIFLFMVMFSMVNPDRMFAPITCFRFLLKSTLISSIFHLDRETSHKYSVISNLSRIIIIFFFKIFYAAD